MSGWDTFKKYFDSWEGQAAKVTERWLESPAVLEPLGSALSGALRAKARVDRATTTAWSLLGLPTKRDQERTLHALNQIQSRLFDLEERLADEQAARARAEAALAAATSPAPAAPAAAPTPSEPARSAGDSSDVAVQHGPR
jgi:hypothetical protein